MIVMKLRSGFVANSSSSSFILKASGPTINKSDFLLNNLYTPMGPIGVNVLVDYRSVYTEDHPQYKHDLENHPIITKDNYFGMYRDFMQTFYYKEAYTSFNHEMQKKYCKEEILDDLKDNSSLDWLRDKDIDKVAEDITVLDRKNQYIYYLLNRYATFTATRLIIGAIRNHNLTIDNLSMLYERYRDKLLEMIHIRPIYSDKELSKYSTIGYALRGTTVDSNCYKSYDKLVEEDNYSPILMYHLIENTIEKEISVYLRCFVKLYTMATIFNEDPNAILVGVTVGNGGGSDKYDYDVFVHNALDNYSPEEIRKNGGRFSVIFKDIE